MTPADKVDRARARLLLSRPWWACLLLRLRVVERPECGTAATDGHVIFYNPAFIAKLTLPEVEGVLCHEVGHCALLHLTRRGQREPVLWNIACDMAVNGLLAADSIVLPVGCVPPGDLDKTAEEHYADMKASGKRPRAGWADLLGSIEASPAQARALERAWKQAIAQAAGLLPGALQRHVESAGETRTPWLEVLADFVTRYVRSSERTWSRSSRRLPGAVPGWRRDPQTQIAIVMDTSGSVDGALLGVFINNAQAMLALNGVTAYVLASDAAVGLVIEPGEPFPATFPGGGGTDFRPALAKCEALDEVAAIVYLTDGEGVYPSGCSKPVIWAMSRATKAPFGITINLNGD